MFYVIEKEFVGHAEFSTGYDKLVNGHYFEVRPEPCRKNMSKEIAVGTPDEPVWLGTTNDWAEYARGEYETEEDANVAACVLAGESGHGHRFVEAGEPGAEDGWNRVYVGDEVWANLVDAGEWLQELSDEELGISEGMSDLDIESLAEELEAISLDSDECRLWGTESFIRERIEQLEEEQAEE